MGFEQIDLDAVNRNCGGRFVVSIVLGHALKVAKSGKNLSVKFQFTVSE